MIPEFLQYPVTKDSGVQWLGAVPEHWGVVTLRRVAGGFGNGTSVEQIDGGETAFPVSRIETISRGVIDFEKVGFVDGTKVAPRYWLDRNDILLSHINSFAMVGNCAIYDGSRPLLHGMNLLRLIPSREVDAKFLLAFLKSTGFRNQIRSACKPSINQVSVTTAAIKSIRLMLPPSAEQEAIVRFIDHFDRRVRRYIQANQKIAALVGDEREALTEQAWKLAGTRFVRLGAIADIVERRIDRHDDGVYTPIGLFNRGRGVFHKKPTVGAELGDSSFFWVAEGDLILSGQFAWEGAVALASSSDAGCVATHRYPILNGHLGMASPEYLWSFFRSGFGHLLLDHHSRGAAGRNRPLSIGTLMKERIPAPPLSTQQEIASLVHLETRLVAATAASALVLREYLTRLVADTITGKIDVRKAAARLPDEIDESLDDAQLAGDDSDGLADDEDLSIGQADG